jgi:Inovirus Coat protein B
MKNLKHALKFGAAAGALAAGNAFAALPAEVTTAMGDAKTDAVALAVLGLLIVIAIAAVKYIKRGV